jgi:osmotically-inducible protein OsmY
MIFPFIPPFPPDDRSGRPVGSGRPGPNDLLALTVLNQLSEDDGLAGAEIIVEVQNRVVILDGVVSSPDMRRAAVAAAWRTPGVFDVSDRIRVSA